MSSSDDNTDNSSRLKDLGYSEDEIRRSTSTSSDVDERRLQNVRVDLVEDVDPVTLTAIGFGLITFNFLVLGNMGDGGSAGIIATIVNSF